jgi:hypothetical protein
MILEKGTDHKHDPIRVFLSEDKDDISLDCILSKIKIVYVDPNVSTFAYNCPVINLYICCFSLFFLCICFS